MNEYLFPLKVVSVRRGEGGQGPYVKEGEKRDFEKSNFKGGLPLKLRGAEKSRPRKSSLRKYLLMRRGSREKMEK